MMPNVSQIAGEILRFAQNDSLGRVILSEAKNLSNIYD